MIVGADNLAFLYLRQDARPWSAVADHF
jgi:hypothetical protein